jgi:hypothetical protein
VGDAVLLRDRDAAGHAGLNGGVDFELRLRLRTATANGRAWSDLGAAVCVAPSAARTSAAVRVKVLGVFHVEITPTPGDHAHARQAGAEQEE